MGYADAFARSGTDLVVEFTHSDRELYTRVPPAVPALATFRDGLPLGDPVGPNGNEVYLRLGQRLGPRLDITAEGRDRRRASADFPAVRASALDVALAYHLGAAQSVGLAYSVYREDPYPGLALGPGSGTGGRGLRRDSAPPCPERQLLAGVLGGTHRRGAIYRALFVVAPFQEQNARPRYLEVGRDRCPCITSRRSET